MKKRNKKNKKCNVVQPSVLSIDKNKYWQKISGVNRLTFQKREQKKATQITAKYLIAAMKT